MRSLFGFLVFFSFYAQGKSFSINEKSLFDFGYRQTCLDESKKDFSRILDFSAMDCGSYKIKHIGLFGARDDAGRLVRYKGLEGSHHYLLDKLGVYNLKPIKREESNKKNKRNFYIKTKSFGC